MNRVVPSNSCHDETWFYSCSSKGSFRNSNNKLTPIQINSTTQKQKKHCTLGKDDAQIEFLIVSQRFLHVIQELMHSSMNPCISPSLLLHKLNFSFNDVTLTEGPGGRRAHDWLTKRLGSLNFSGQPPIYVLRFLKGMPFSQRICSRTSPAVPQPTKNIPTTLDWFSMGQIKRPA